MRYGANVGHLGLVRRFCHPTLLAKQLERMLKCRSPEAGGIHHIPGQPMSDFGLVQHKSIMVAW